MVDHIAPISPTRVSPLGKVAEQPKLEALKGREGSNATPSASHLSQNQLKGGSPGGLSGLMRRLFHPKARKARAEMNRCSNTAKKAFADLQADLQQEKLDAMGEERIPPKKVKAKKLTKSERAQKQAALERLNFTPKQPSEVARVGGEKEVTPPSLADRKGQVKKSGEPRFKKMKGAFENFKNFFKGIPERLKARFKSEADKPRVDLNKATTIEEGRKEILSTNETNQVNIDNLGNTIENKQKQLDYEIAVQKAVKILDRHEIERKTEFSGEDKKAFIDAITEANGIFGYKMSANYFQDF